MRHLLRKPSRILSLLVASLFLLALPTVLVLAESDGPTDTLSKAWRRAASLASYTFDSGVVQSVHPTARLENVGRQTTTRTLQVQGAMDQRAETMNLHIAGDTGIGGQVADLKIEDGQVFGRLSADDPWTAVDQSPADVFAPGGDPLGFLAAASNIHELQAGESALFPGSLLPDVVAGSVTRYAFDLDGEAFAEFMRGQVEDYLRRHENMPGSMVVALPQSYAGMSGQGEIWIGADGLPLRQMIHMEMPPAKNAIDWVEADITTTFSNWDTSAGNALALLARDPARLLTQPATLAAAISPKALDNLAVTVSAGGLLLLIGLFLLLTIVKRRSPRFYAAVAVLIVTATALSPLAQVSEANQAAAFNQRQEEKAAAAAAEQDKSVAQASLEQELSGTDFDPHSAPQNLTPPQQQAERQPTAGGPTLDQRASSAMALDVCGYATGADCDGDGLTDDTEILRLGTDPGLADSDGDGISDNAEVTGFDVAGVTWYTNPLNADSNGDGLIDSMECPQRADMNTDGTLNGGFVLSACRDGDSDGEPDVWDYDNDGDKVPDNVDISPDYTGNISSELHDDLTLDLSGFTTGKAIFVDLAIRPQEDRFLYLTDNVVDWPAADVDGQVTRVYTDTLADIGISHPDGKASNGDMILKNLLEITIPFDSSNPTGSLPKLSSYTGTITAATPLEDWLDEDALAQYGISVTQDESGDRVAYVALNVVQDKVGDTPVAWSAHMLYRPEVAAWGTGHTARMLWMVYGITDRCSIPDSVEPESDEYQTWCDVENLNHWTAGSDIELLQTYQEPVYLTGLAVREDHGTDAAIIAQNNALSQPYEDMLWHLTAGLQEAYLDGQLDSGNNRLDVAAIGTRFDDGSPLSDGSPLRWGIPKSALSVSTHTGYSEQAAGLVDVVNNHTPALLNSTYPSAPDDSVVTLLFARDDHYISTAMGDVGPGTVTVNDATGEISVGLGGTHVTTYSTLNWAPFTKTADGWIAADVYPTVDNLVTQLGSVITDADLTALSGGVTPDDLDMARRGAISVAQNYYLASFMGRSNVTAVDGTPVNDAWIDDADLTLGSGEKPVVVLNQVILDSYQLFFLKSSVTTLDGELVSSTVFEVPSTATVLQNLGQMALNWDTPVSALKSVKTPLKYFLKEYYKQQGLILKTNISIGKIAKNASRYVAALSIAIQAFTIIYDFYPDNMVVQLVTDSLVILSETMSAFSAFTAIWHYYNAVSLAQSAVLKGIHLNLTISASVTLAIGIAVAVGAFLYVVFTNDLSPGSIAYNMAVAALVAQIIVAVLLAILAFSVIGTAFVAVLALIDAILYLICRVENRGDNSIFCTGITGQVARALAEAFYKVDPIIKLGKKDRLQFAFDNLELVDKQLGFTVNNQLALSVTVTNTIALDDKLFFSGTNDSPGNSQYRDDAAQKLNNSTFAYFLQQSPVNQHAGLEFNQVNWTRLNKEKYQAVFTADNTFDLSTAGIGINSGLPLYMTEALLVKYMECTYAVVTYTCDFGKEFRTSVHLDWTGNLRFDLFPATFGQFYSLVSAGLSGGNAYRFSWDSRFPALQDADGDGLRNQAFEGADPNDLTADSDGDGLYDFWEVKNGTDPLRVDDDCDGLSDYWEVFHQLDPWAPDSDGDGLLDGKEFFHPPSYNSVCDTTPSSLWEGGWTVVYDYAGDTPLVTLVSADPAEPDSDGDTITDKLEKVYGYNPNVHSVLNVLSLDADAPNPYVRPGFTMAYTATVKNELDNRIAYGLLEAELPTDNVQNTQVIDTLMPQASADIQGDVTAPNVSQTQVMSLTIHAGAVLDDPATGRVLWLHMNETSGSTTFVDNSLTVGGPHNATCTSGATCPSAVQVNGTDGGALDFDGSDVITVPDHSDFDLDQFTISMWVQRDTTSGAQSFINKGATGFSIGSNGGPVIGTIYLDNCTTPVTVSGTLTPVSASYHVVLTYGNGLLRLYVNGVQAGSAAAASLCHNDDNIQIGSGVNGIMDEVQIFSRALSAEEVANLARIPVFFLPNFKSTPSPAYDDYDASQYQASEITCGETNSEFPCPAVAAGKAGNGFAFDESNYMLTSSKVLDLGRNSSSFSMAFWLYPQTGYTPDDNHYDQLDQMIIGFNGFLFSDYTWAGPSLSIRKNGRVIVRFGYRDHSGYCEAASTTGVVSTDQWQHLSLVFDGTNFRVYKNGVLSDTFSDPSCSGQTPSGLGVFHIGHGVNPAVKFDNITCNGCDNGEAFIWSDLTNLNNGYGRQELVWLATRNQLHNHEVNTIDQWATGPGGYLDFQVCNWDSDPNTPNGCDNPPGGEDQALYFDEAPTSKIEETIAYDHALGSVYQYLWLPSRYNVDLNYTVYSTGLKGRLDEINLFNVALTGSEVQDVYNGSLRGLKLKLDEPPGQHLFEDTSGNNFSTSCSGTSCPDSGIPGRANQSLRFDGVDDYLTTEAADTLGLTNSSFTAMAWVKLDSLSGDQSILGTDMLIDREGLHLVVRNGVPYMGFYGSGNDTAGTTTLETGKWYHLAFRYNKDTQQQAIFVNGVQDVAATGKASFLGTDTVHVGRSRGGHYIDGLIDHVVIQRTALSVADIRAIMNEAPVLNLHLDEDLATTTFIDDTPRANHATCTAASCPEAGAKGQMREAAVFDGSDRLLTVAADPAYNLNQFTVGLWVKPNNRRAQIQPLVSKRDMANGGGNVNYALLLHPDNTVRFLMQQSNCSSYRQLNTATALLDGQWNHVMATYDGQTMRLYINGSPDPIAETQTNGACLTSQDITVGGGSYVDTWSDFNGEMDEITVYGAALSPAEVRDIYDYQVSWYDLTYSLPVVIDNDAPTISMQLDRNFVSAGSGKIWLVSASDVGSYVKSAFANLLHGSTNEITVLQQVGDAWLYQVPDLLPGVSYTLQLGARDAADNYGQSPDYDFTVDGQAPTATVDAAQQTEVLPVTASLTLNGQVSDNLSGVAPASVSVALLDEDGESVSGYQQATVSATRSQSDWSVEYPFDFPPYGTYDVLVRASDDVGNTSETDAGTVRLDGIAPSGDVSLPTPQIKPDATVVSGTATDIPYPMADRYMTLHFEEASGATGFVDSSGRFYNAACSTCPAAGQPGKYGFAADFDGVSDALQISASQPASTTAELGLYDSSFTVMAWVNPDAITGAIQPVFGSAANGDLQSLTLGLLEDGRPAMRFGGAGNAVEGPDPLPAGQWVNLAFRYNKEGQEQAIFVNGVAVDTQSGKQPFVGESPVFVGSGADPGHFDGRIDDLFVVGRALTADEIYHIANPLDTNVTEVLLRLRHQDDGDPGPDAGVWIDVTPAVHAANIDTWSFTPPDDTRLGPTRIDLKVTDSSGLQRYLPSVWNGEVTDTPLAVTLASFDATSQPGAVLLTWETVSELDNLGFNLYRAETEGGPWTKLNQDLIASPNPGGAAGSSYQWIDESVTPSVRYWYRLESVDLAGQPETVGEINLVAGGATLMPRTFLPLIMK